MKLLFVFLDGVGLGEADANPFVAAKTPFLSELLGGALTRALPEQTSQALVVKHLDARLGLPGLPQSATGQTTLLTGKNGAAAMGRHYGPWPGPTLKKLLARGTLFSERAATGDGALLANAYPPGYFEALAKGRQRVNVPVYAAQQAGLTLLNVQDYQQGKAVSADLTGAYLHQQDSRLPMHTPRESGEMLARLAGRHPFTFFDFWLSDVAGHRWPFSRAVELIEELDAFLAGAVAALQDVTLLITSDHGNLEAKRVKTHTDNPVPLIAVGEGAPAFAEASALLDVAPAIRRLLSLTARPG